MWRCLIASLVLHAAMLIAIQMVIPLGVLLKPLRTYRVEFIRPPVESMKREDIGGADLAHQDKSEKPRAQDTEETISLDTKDLRYSSYAGVIKAMLERQWAYPEEAKRNLLEGRLQVLFSLNPEGHLVDLKILESSGHGILDREAMNAVNTAAPFPPFPASVAVAKLNIRATFDYRLTAGRP